MDKVGFKDVKSSYLPVIPHEHTANEFFNYIIGTPSSKKALEKVNEEELSLIRAEYKRRFNEQPKHQYFQFEAMIVSGRK